MSRRTASLELVLPAREAHTPAYTWLYEGIRKEILDGRFRPGTRLPATRDLARQYGLSRGTLIRAFDELKAEGYIDGTVGSGSYVSRILPETLLQAPREQESPKEEHRRPPLSLSAYAQRARTFSGYEMRPTRAFRANLPALDLFPIDVWSRTAARRLRRISTQMLMGCDPQGYLPLREAIADYLGVSRGVRCSAHHVVIVSGVQEALDLTARIFLDPGDRVCMEDPGYPGAAMVFEAVGARISLLRLDEEGVRLPTRSPHRPRLLYTTPGHQFPLGTTMSLPRRLQLLDWAQKSGALIFEDDYDSEYRYSGRPMPALQGLDRNNLVVFAGSFSKVLFPSLRLGYLVLPSAWVDRYSAAISITSRHAPLIEQAVLCDFMVEGHFGRHIRRMREIYAERLAVLVEAATQDLGGLLEISKIEAGLQTTGWLPPGIHEDAAVTSAAKRKIDVIPLSEYARSHGKREGLQLGFAAIAPRDIRRGVQELAIALESQRRSTP